MEVTDIEKGRFVFRPRPSTPVSLPDLRKAVTKAGYEIEGTWIEVTGELTPAGLKVPETGQVFHLEGDQKLLTLGEPAGGGKVTASGSWDVTGGQETIRLEAARPAEGTP